MAPTPTARLNSSIRLRFAVLLPLAICISPSRILAQTTPPRHNPAVTTTKAAVPQSGWAVSGHIYNSSNQPVSGYNVFFVDSHKNYQSAYGFAYTSNIGSYTFNYTGTSTATIFLEVCDTSGNPVYLANSPFQPKLGQSTILDITLPKASVAPQKHGPITIPHLPNNTPRN